MKKIIFISHDPLTQQIIDNFFFKEFINDGVEIEYWCVRYIVKYSHDRILVNEIVTDYYTEIRSIEQLKEKLSLQSVDTFFCLELWFNWDARLIFRALRLNRERTFSIDWYINVPRPSSGAKLIDDVSKFRILKLIAAVGRRINRKLFSVYANAFRIAPAPLLFAPGSRSKSIVANRSVSVLHHHDYSIYKNSLLTDVAPVLEGMYAVFLDNMITNHPDIVRMNGKTMDPALYFSKLNRLFDYIEKEERLEVVIAAHPKSSYTTEFGIRKIIKNQTNDLVKNSSLVIAHHSNAIYFAILNYKPLLLVYSNEFLNDKNVVPVLNNMYHSIMLYRDTLDAGIVNLDELNNLSLKKVDTGKYNQFIMDYISHKDSRSNYDIVKATLQGKQ